MNYSPKRLSVIAATAGALIAITISALPALAHNPMLGPGNWMSGHGRQVDNNGLNENLYNLHGHIYTTENLVESISGYLENMFSGYSGRAFNGETVTEPGVFNRLQRIEDLLTRQQQLIDQLARNQCPSYVSAPPAVPATPGQTSGFTKPSSITDKMWSDPIIQKLELNKPVATPTKKTTPPANTTTDWQKNIQPYLKQVEGELQKSTAPDDACRQNCLKAQLGCIQNAKAQDKLLNCTATESACEVSCRK